MSCSQARRSSDLVSNRDERRWVINIRTFLDDEEDGEGTEVLASIHSVPKALISSNPEFYTPQMVAISPYHQWRPELYEMERYKLAAARRIRRQSRPSRLSFPTIVQHLQKLETRIRACYNKYLDVEDETLAWMMAVNGSFLLEFLRIHVCREDQVSMTMSKLNHDSILRDVVMLENQIPLFVLRKVLEIQYSSSETADDIMLSMLKGFSGELSPFKTMETIDVSKCHHILDFLYQMIVPNLEQIPSEDSEQVVELEEQKEHTDEKESISYRNQLLIEIWTTLSKMTQLHKPFRLILNFPWKILSNIMKELKKEDDNSMIEEITIPSVSDLSKAGVRIVPTNGNISTIGFDVQTVTLHLPIISIDNNTDVVLRNLVAYEASYAIGPLVFARYTELINGIIDTEEDVRLLREKGVVWNGLKSDKEAADMWNGMSKSIRLTKVPLLDKVIEDVNKYHTGTWKVKLNNVLKHYVYRSWRFLTLLAAVVLLFLSTFEVFCSVYGCSRVSTL
ncbi:Pentatricopeptide repeat superfamily protein isoform 1 [Hibiscus syriacus]|uniref:Pentatricopeptide repeat superfamily protein isoform 1 n=1 Tax=Hibiscus syriacus TaxID=106335 RepID=A0A6A3BAT9_HIBSY|nr:putative UPF0481 protein At3g02645 [Hibiscus syriacus]KAE8713077.1 Pentatricopeptide repeat superfamily protein isoform 1 [Hibiscus syriacus]